MKIYLLGDDYFFEDSKREYPSTLKTYEGNFTIDRTGMLNDVNSKMPEIPAVLINSGEHILGCPDCSDGGGIYFETKIDGEVRYWFIDKQRIPAGLEDFVNALNETLIALR